MKYIGMNVTVQEYNWKGILDETGARLMAANNYSAYRNMVAIYGKPYSNVTKFIVYEFSNDASKEVNRYDSLQKAKEALKVEEWLNIHRRCNKWWLAIKLVIFAKHFVTADLVYDLKVYYNKKEVK